jgi:hypothetical protein
MPEEGEKASLLVGQQFQRLAIFGRRNDYGVIRLGVTFGKLTFNKGSILLNAAAKFLQIL